MALSVKEFAGKIKQKYPAYKDVPDAELAQKIVEKHPEYKDQVDLGGSQTQDSPSSSGVNLGGALNTLKSISDKVNTGTKDFYLGQLQGAGSTISNMGQLGSKVLQAGYDKTIGALTGKKAIDPTQVNQQIRQDYLTPSSTAGKIGFASEQIGETFIPVGNASRAATAEKTGQFLGSLTKNPTVSKVLSKVGQQAVGLAGDVLESGLKTTLQTGDTAKGAESAKMTAAIGGVTRGAELLKDAVKPLSGRIINSLIKPQKRDFAYGKNPGKTVAAEGIVANSLDDLMMKVDAKSNEIGKKLDDVLKGKIVNGGDILTPIDDAIREAAAGGPQNAGLVKRLNEAKQAIQYNHELSKTGEIVQGAQRDLSAIKGEDVRKLKTFIGKLGRWTENPSDDELVNKTLQKVYGKLKGATESVAPQSKSLNQKLADLIGASSALNNRTKVLERQNMVSLPDIGLGTGASTAAAVLSGGAAIPTVLAGLGAAGVRKLLGTTAAKTRIASWLASTPSEEKQRLYKAAPVLLDIFKKEFGNKAL